MSRKNEEQNCCGNCRFWQSLDDDITSGLCLCHAPLPVLFQLLAESDDDRMSTGAVWPETDIDNWCGEWEKGDEE